MDVPMLQPGEGRRMQTATETVVKMEATAEWDFAVTEAVVPAGFVGPPTHLHRSFEEALYVLEGSIELEVGGRREWFPAGSFVLFPRGVSHRVWGPGDQQAKILQVCSPGLLTSMEELGGILAKRPYDPAELASSLARFETEVLGE